jgi:hypothetical protein
MSSGSNCSPLFGWRFLSTSSIMQDRCQTARAATVMRERLPHMREMTGIHNACVAFDRASGRGAVISTWDAQEQATFDGAPELLARLQALGARDGQTVIYLSCWAKIGTVGGRSLSRLPSAYSLPRP